jgi:two-component system CheB/CheR fusion protein
MHPASTQVSESDRSLHEPPPGLPTSVLDALPHFTAVLTPAGAVRHVNASGLAAIQQDIAQLEGMCLWMTPWWDFDPQAQGQVRLACARAALGEQVRLHAPMRTGSGTPAIVDLAVAPVHDSEGRLQQLVVSAAAASAHDVVDSDLLTRYRRKDEFLAMLAHELRNPLAPLRNAAAMLRLTDHQLPQREAISALVDRQIGHMARLLDDLLDASRIDQGKIVLSLEPVELGSLLVHALEGARALTDARDQHVILSKPQRQVWMNADPVRLTQIVDNLLSNASKFSEPGSTIRLTLTARQRLARLTVSDEGQGIDEELLPRVFDLFTQGARALDRSQGGLGIGLSLVRNLALMHGGSVTAASAGIGRGATFVVTLPLLARRIAPYKPEVAAALPSQARRVLVVDDNVDAAESLAELLVLKGHEAKAVTEPRAALAMVPEFAPEVVLLDIGLPEIDGFEVARLLRKIPCTAHSLLVAVTGYGQAEDRKASSAAGFDYHLVKPVSFRQIEELIDRRH